MLYNIGYFRLGGPNRLTGGAKACDWGGGGHGPPGLYVKKGSGQNPQGHFSGYGAGSVLNK
jgi:hypothetical protein